MRLKGRYGRIVVEGNLVAEMREWAIDIGQETLEADVFGDVWKEKDVGSLEWKGTFSGFFDPTDDAQNAIRDALVTGNVISDVKFYDKYSTTTGDTVYYWTPDTDTNPDAGIIITGVSMRQAHNGLETFEVTFEGTGPVKHVSETVT